MWSVEHFESLYGGIDAIHTAFYEEYSLGTLARLVMCIGMQESTGDFLLGYPYAQSQGLMQVSPASVLSDLTRTVRLYIHIRDPIWYRDKQTLPILVRPSCCGMVWKWCRTYRCDQSIPIVRFEYQSLSTQTQSWSWCWRHGTQSVGESRQ
jgi:hypothetical protein